VLPRGDDAAQALVQHRHRAVRHAWHNTKHTHTHTTPCTEGVRHRTHRTLDERGIDICVICIMDGIGKLDGPTAMCRPQGL
jgi:hypothetical protein